MRWTPTLMVILTSLAAACSQPLVEIPPALAQPNIVIIDIDSLRADRVDGLRDGEPIAPTLQRLSRQGAFFSNAISQSGWTLPAVSALMTGRYPPLMQLGNDELPYREVAVSSLPEILALLGYHSAVIWGQSLPSRFPDFSWGFTEQIHSGKAAAWGAPFKNWLDSGPPEPFLLFVHEMDLHNPMPRPPTEALHRYVPDLPYCRQTQLDHVQNTLAPVIGPDAADDHVIGHYDGALHFYDGVVQGMLDHLEERGLLAHSVVFITSNHGNDLFDHRILGHSNHYDSVLRVPLIMLDPALHSPANIEAQVQSIDLAPTILARVGMDPAQQMQGHSLLPLVHMAEGTYPASDVFSLTNVMNASLRTARYKIMLRIPADQYVAHGEGHRPPCPQRFELYDLITDPQESNNLARADIERCKEMAQRLSAWMKVQTVVGNGGTLQVDDNARQALQERGYWDVVNP